MRTIGAKRLETKVEVILGVDTHLDFHVAVAIDHLGREAWASPVCQRPEGLREAPVLGGGFWPREVRRGRRYQQLRGRTRPPPEGQGIEVLEVERPKHRRRSSHRNVKKSDPSDAERAARAGIGRRSIGRAQERRRACGDDQGPACGPRSSSTGL